MALRAAIALSLSAFAGFSWDQTRSGGQGLMITLLVAAHFSNLNLSPPSHYLYDLCWTAFLPTSLALLLLSPSDEEEAEHDSTRGDIAAVGIPFFIGSIGSVVGCTLSFLICLWGADHRASGRLLLRPREAVVTAGCLCASYIGGPYNFFTAARIISVELGDDGGMLGSLFGASAADLLAMALYYAVITALLSSTTLQSWFPRQTTAEEERDSKSRLIQTQPPPAKRRVVAVITSACLASGIVAISRACDNGVLGTECACIVALGALLSRLLPKALSRKSELLADINSVSNTMSDFCFQLLFAAIGASANLREAVRQGAWHSASSFLFSAFALSVHLVITLLGSFGAARLFPRIPFGMDEVTVASNAGIGGPVTAAAFAGKKTPNRAGLVVAATLWGVVGYAIGTRIGVRLSKALLPILLAHTEWDR